MVIENNALQKRNNINVQRRDNGVTLEGERHLRKPSKASQIVSISLQKCWVRCVWSSLSGSRAHAQAQYEPKRTEAVLCRYWRDLAPLSERGNGKGESKRRGTFSYFPLSRKPKASVSEANTFDGGALLFPKCIPMGHLLLHDNHLLSCPELSSLQGVEVDSTWLPFHHRLLRGRVCVWKRLGDNLCIA